MKPGAAEDAHAHGVLCGGTRERQLDRRLRIQVMRGRPAKWIRSSRNYIFNLGIVTTRLYMLCVSSTSMDRDLGRGVREWSV